MNLRKPDPTTRLLLGLWSLDGMDAAVKRSEVMKRARIGKERVGDYSSIVDALVADGSIAVEMVGRSKVFRLLAPGVDRLRAGVLNPEFGFEGTVVVGTRFVSPLLRFFREVVAIAPIVEASPVETIEDYEAFKSVALETFDRLMADYSYVILVPIYHIRREIGDQVTRAQFNEWMTQLHVDEILEFSGCGQSKNVTQETLRDSIKPPIGEIWYLAERVK